MLSASTNIIMMKTRSFQFSNKILLHLVFHFLQSRLYGRGISSWPFGTEIKEMMYHTTEEPSYCSIKCKIIQRSNSCGWIMEYVIQLLATNLTLSRNNKSVYLRIDISIMKTLGHALGMSHYHGHPNPHSHLYLLKNSTHPHSHKYYDVLQSYSKWHHQTSDIYNVFDKWEYQQTYQWAVSWAQKALE